MVYGRRVDGRTLELEPSGALLRASLVMRDRQTDSWWSIMTSDAIAGALAGTDLPELPVGEKTTWDKWRRLHPTTLVLSVDGAEHVATSPYEKYFDSERTYRDLEVGDDRLPPKTPVFAFELDGEPFAVAHQSFGGGRLLEIPGAERRLLVFRPRKASIYASSEAWIVDPDATTPRRSRVRELLESARAGAPGFSRLAGFDTFWYTWVGVNDDTHLLRP